jgi:hypothetical protein
MSTTKDIVKHGKRSSYVMGCHCQDCTDANTRYQAMRLRSNPAALAKKRAAEQNWKKTDRGRATSKAWQQKNREKLRERSRQYRDRNRASFNAKQLEQWKRTQAESIGSAVNNRQPWTQADDRHLLTLINDPAVSLIDAAKQLGRSYGAITNRQAHLRRASSPMSRAG